MYILETCSVLYFVATSSVPYLYASFIPHLHISHTTIPYSASSFVSCTYHVPRAAWSTTYNIHTFSLNLSSRMCTKSSRNPILIALRTTNQHGPRTRSIFRTSPHPLLACYTTPTYICTANNCCSEGSPEMDNFWKQPSSKLKQMVSSGVGQRKSHMYICIWIYIYAYVD